MTIGRQKLSEYEKSIERAKQLALEYSFAAKPLKFYGQILQSQKELFSALTKSWGDEPIAPRDDELRTQLNFMVLLPSFPNFLAVVQATAPDPLVHAAEELSRKGSATWIGLLSEYWATGGKADENGVPRSDEGRSALQEFLAHGFLQPYAEFIAQAMGEIVPESTPYVCPKCDSLPLLGVLRPEGDGGKRFLRCAFCAYEWGFRRILCPGCGEEREDKLPVYVAEQFPHIRMECCDTCKYYLRTIDLTKNGNAMPEVDDLAAIPLTLWAQEYGYKRIHTNLLGA
jgi:FdhE protein